MLECKVLQFKYLRLQGKTVSEAMKEGHVENYRGFVTRPLSHGIAYEGDSADARYFEHSLCRTIFPSPINNLTNFLTVNFSTNPRLKNAGLSRTNYLVPLHCFSLGISNF